MIYWRNYLKCRNLKTEVKEYRGKTERSNISLNRVAEGKAKWRRGNIERKNGWEYFRWWKTWIPKFNVKQQNKLKRNIHFIVKLQNSKDNETILKIVTADITTTEKARTQHNKNFKLLRETD